MKILVIEDETDIREAVLDWLTFEGHKAISAANGREGVALALTSLPDLIISDITMPELDGYGVLLELQKQPKTHAIPFIFLTARADKSFIRHGMELGADDYVTKPFTRGELLGAIEARVNRHKAIVADAQQEIGTLKTNIVQMVSQELKNPLASIVFVQQIIERQLGQIGEEQLADLLKTMRTGTDRLKYLVQQAVYAAQFESGDLSSATIQSNGTSIFLWQILPPAIELARQYAYYNARGLISQTRQHQDLCIWGDSHLLKHAFAEMIANLLNVTTEKQAITINQQSAEGLAWIHILTREMPNKADTAGLEADSGAEPVNEAPGLDMGFEVSKRIIQAHEGLVELEYDAAGLPHLHIGLPLYHGEDYQ